ncbi:MAG: tRNA (adenosine(37)-N6)-threonylcarbamoyltransferase complex transferase subunit TsaD [Thermodesulfobacteriota bacterium]
MRLLAIESSCDETAAAVMTDRRELLASIVNSQVDIHGVYGGVVPELASRKHVENIGPVVAAALAAAGLDLDDIDAVAVTRGPGLVGSLLVGLSFAKALAYVKGIPLIGVDHMAGHLASIEFSEQPVSYPCVTLIASGGHTALVHQRIATETTVIGRCLDDAAGEAFDKVGKILGLDYPGGPEISRLARAGDPAAVAFPRAWLDRDSLDFSFSGLKTAVALHVANHGGSAAADICASFQEAVVEVLVEKTLLAARRFRVPQVAMAGGVAANPRLRQMMAARAEREGLRFTVPPADFCTDNAAMIALAALLRHDGTDSFDIGMDVYSRAAGV